jgi:chromosome segregation ATPase
MSTETIILFIVTFVNIVGQLSVIFIAIRKLPKEEGKLDSESKKSTSEAIESSSRALKNYSEEISKLKEDNQAMEKRYEERIKKAEDRIFILEQEQVESTNYIKDLLAGIERLIGQLKMRGEVPVWQPQKMED